MTEGVYKGVQLFLEIKERGYTGSWALMAQYLAKYRLHHPPPRPLKSGRGRPSGTSRSGGKVFPKLKPQPLLSARKASFVMLKNSEDLTEKQQELLIHLRNFDSEIEAAYQLSQEFVRMLRGAARTEFRRIAGKGGAAGGAGTITGIGKFCERDKARPGSSESWANRGVQSRSGRGSG